MKNLRGVWWTILGFSSYGLFQAINLYLVGFLGDAIVPKTIDSGPPTPLGKALLVDVLLVGLFAVQHSLMARRSFKRWWIRFVPPAIERSTYVLFSSLALALLLWQWRPIAEPTIWRVESPPGRWLVHAVFFLGWLVLLISTFLIDHFEMFGLRQVVAGLRGRPLPESQSQLTTPLFYRCVRHPIYVGFLLAFWATPVMSAGHFLFSAMCTAYILIGIAFEERDLLAEYGSHYQRYREKVGMLWPRLWRGRRDLAPVPEDTQPPPG